MASWDEEEQMEALLGGAAVSDQRELGTRRKGWGTFYYSLTCHLGFGTHQNLLEGYPRVIDLSSIYLFK